jgi:hypothetical protein
MIKRRHPSPTKNDDKKEAPITNKRECSKGVMMNNKK